MDGGAAEGRDPRVDLLLEPDVLEHRRNSHPRLEMSSPPIPDDLLLDIFRRIHEPADLVRISAACVSFRRLITDRSFLRRYRKAHAPPFLGFLDARKYLQHAEPPYPSASAASAVALVADFSFLPTPASNWLVKDIRDGRVLLGRRYFKSDCSVKSMEMVVCDPLHQRYVLLPPIPDEICRGNMFLVPPSEEAAEETAFRLICMARRGDKLVALVFSSSTGQWQDGPSHSWSYSFNGLLILPGVATISPHHYAYGCFYWVTKWKKTLLVLDTRRMEFSIVDAPPEAEAAIVEAGEGRIGMFLIPDDTPDLHFIIRRNSGESFGQWQLEKTISLGFSYYFTGSMGGRLFLEHNGGILSLDVKTFQLETVCASKYNHRMIFPRAYSNFPPSLLSSPTVASGVDIRAKKETLEGGAASSSA